MTNITLFQRKFQGGPNKSGYTREKVDQLKVKSENVKQK